MWELRNDKLNMQVYGQTLEELLNNILEEYMFLHDAYVMEDDDNLTDDAIDIKRTLLQVADKL